MKARNVFQTLLVCVNFKFQENYENITHEFYKFTVYERIKERTFGKQTFIEHPHQGLL